jgi:hypothetical protein
MLQIPVVGQRVQIRWDARERWEGTVVEPRTQEAKAKLTEWGKVLVEWDADQCALDERQEWFPGRHRQVHLRNELIAVA